MKISGQYAILEEAGHLFAQLSGDFNPLHVDRQLARRLQFGDTVVHGVHHMLRTWDSFAGEASFIQNLSLVALRASFPAPVKYGDIISYSSEYEPNRRQFQIVAETRGRCCLVLDLEFSQSDDDRIESVPISTINALIPRQESVDQPFPPKLQEDSCLLSCDLAAARQLFPVLSQSLSPSLLAQILACTWVVGMKCPGLHSVFSGLEFSIKPRDRTTREARLGFQVTQSDKRFSRVSIAVNGPQIEGTLDAFFRPPPVAQPSYVEISAEVSQGQFIGQRALVVGGSRGVGETTGKILAAGGADVCITYFRGEAEARAICDDIVRGGASCDIQCLDVLSASIDDIRKVFPGPPPTHVYYFSTPKIEALNDGLWDGRVFEEYCRYYLSAVDRLFHGLLASEAHHRVDLYYPSTIFIDQPRKGFAEYAVAKAAGEALCRQLTRKFPGLQVKTPRLPMMMTDQTASILPIKIDSVKNVMLAELEQFALAD